MICSRGYCCMKILNTSSKILKPSLNNVISRPSHGRWGYRQPVPPTESQLRRAEIIGGLIWGWILYHCINDYDHILGEYHTPDPASWTDEELGIPPDSAGI